MPKSIWLPLTHWLGALLKPFFFNYYQAGVFLAIVSGSAAVAFLFLFCQSLGQGFFALPICFLLMSLWPLINLSSHAMTEPLHLALTLVALIYFVKEKWRWMGFFIALSCLVRLEAVVIWAYFLFILALQSYRTKDTNIIRDFFLYSMWGPLVCFGYFQLAFGNFYTSFDLNLKLARAEREIYPFSLQFILNKIFQGYSYFLIVIILVFGLMALFSHRRSKSRAIVFLAFVLFSLKLTTMLDQGLPAESRYVLIPIVILFPFSFEFIFKKVGKIAALGILSCLIYWTSRESFDQFKQMSLKVADPAYSGIAVAINRIPSDAIVLFDLEKFDACYVAHQTHMNIKNFYMAPDRINRYIKYIDNLQIVDFKRQLLNGRFDYLVLQKGYSKRLELIRKFEQTNSKRKKLLRFEEVAQNSRFVIFRTHLPRKYFGLESFLFTF